MGAGVASAGARARARARVLVCACAFARERGAILGPAVALASISSVRARARFGVCKRRSAWRYVVRCNCGASSSSIAARARAIVCLRSGLRLFSALGHTSGSGFCCFTRVAIVGAVASPWLLALRTRGARPETSGLCKSKTCFVRVQSAVSSHLSPRQAEAISLPTRPAGGRLDELCARGILPLRPDIASNLSKQATSWQAGISRKPTRPKQLKATSSMAAMELQEIKHAPASPGTGVLLALQRDGVPAEDAPKVKELQTLLRAADIETRRRRAADATTLLRFLRAREHDVAEAAVWRAAHAWREHHVRTALAECGADDASSTEGWRWRQHADAAAAPTQRTIFALAHGMGLRLDAAAADGSPVLYWARQLDGGVARARTWPTAS